ncbi:sulfur carrier protein ThiS [Vibrio rhodolitus]|uniref:sulfur carrier protein ThiS n=1 Tax=Vibrio rhodolitus TaxID=2231649 RepID=UPI000E0C5F1A|nr:sulfur carrier protein ThiS [Vibrio rhodolitus]
MTNPNSTDITITINQQTQVVARNSHLGQIISLLGLPATGCVFAINNQVIPQSEWSNTTVNQGDQIALFQAIAGG